MAGTAPKPRILPSSSRFNKEPLPVLKLEKTSASRPKGDAGVETRPCFASSWLQSDDHIAKDVVDRYDVEGVGVALSSPSGCSFSLYSISPPEYRLNPIHTQALARAIDHIVEVPPAELEFGNLATMKSFIKTRAKDVLYTYLESIPNGKASGAALEAEVDGLADILAKYTAGYGLMETLLSDENVQDIYVDAPSHESPVQVVLRSDTDKRVRQKCRTNILIGRKDLQGFVSRVKLETGLPFSEAHPVLEADIRRLRARVTLVGPPLSDKGISLAIRKHSGRTWTLPGLVRNDCLSPLLSGFLWCCVLGRRSILVAGSRGAGKTTLLGAMMLEFPLSQRILLIEDTPEIPVSRMQSLGFDVQTLRFNGHQDGPSSAEDALRVSLRMGESAIVIGEVRGAEAKVLYESMRAGSAGSSVLGTIHGNSAEGVLDRAVEDLGVSERAFSSTDIIVVIGLMRSPDGTRFERRVVEVAEVRPRGQSVELVPLFATRSGCTCATPTTEFTVGCKTIQGCSNALRTSPDHLLNIIRAKSHADQVLAESSNPIAVGDDFRSRSNEVLTHGLFDPEGPEKALTSWKEWVNDRFEK